MAIQFTGDEKRLNFIDRLGLAWCRLSCWEWDDIAGPKPCNFDDLPNYIPEQTTLVLGKRIKSKYDIVTPALEEIQSIIGRMNVSRCWWKFALGRTEEEWKRWYTEVHLFRGKPLDQIQNEIDTVPYRL